MIFCWLVVAVPGSVTLKGRTLHSSVVVAVEGAISSMGGTITSSFVRKADAEWTFTLPAWNGSAIKAWLRNRFTGNSYRGSFRAWVETIDGEIIFCEGSAVGRSPSSRRLKWAEDPVPSTTTTTDEAL